MRTPSTRSATPFGRTTPRGEQPAALSQPPEDGGNIMELTETGRIILRPHQDEVIGHHQPTLPKYSFADVALLQRGRVSQNDIRLAPRGQRQRLPGPHRDGLEPAPALALEPRRQRIQQASIVGTGGCGQDDISPGLAMEGREAHPDQQHEP